MILNFKSIIICIDLKNTKKGIKMKHETLNYTNFNFNNIAVNNLSVFIIDGIKILAKDQKSASEFFPFFNKNDSRFDKSVIDNFKSKELIVAVYGVKKSIENGKTMSISILNKKGHILKNLGSSYAAFHFKSIEKFLDSQQKI